MKNSNGTKKHRTESSCNAASIAAAAVASHADIIADLYNGQHEQQQQQQQSPMNINNNNNNHPGVFGSGSSGYPNINDLLPTFSAGSSLTGSFYFTQGAGGSHASSSFFPNNIEEDQDEEDSGIGQARSPKVQQNNIASSVAAGEQQQQEPKKKKPTALKLLSLPDAMPSFPQKNQLPSLHDLLPFLSKSSSSKDGEKSSGSSPLFTSREEDHNAESLNHDNDDKSDDGDDDDSRVDNMVEEDVIFMAETPKHAQSHSPLSLTSDGSSSSRGSSTFGSIWTQEEDQLNQMMDCTDEILLQRTSDGADDSLLQTTSDSCSSSNTTTGTDLTSAERVVPARPIRLTFELTGMSTNADNQTIAEVGVSGFLEREVSNGIKIRCNLLTKKTTAEAAMTKPTRLQFHIISKTKNNSIPVVNFETANAIVSLLLEAERRIIVQYFVQVDNDGEYFATFTSVNISNLRLTKDGYEIINKFLLQMCECSVDGGIVNNTPTSSPDDAPQPSVEALNISNIYLVDQKIIGEEDDQADRGMMVHDDGNLSLENSIIDNVAASSTGGTSTKMTTSIIASLVYRWALSFWMQPLASLELEGMDVVMNHSNTANQTSNDFDSLCALLEKPNGKWKGLNYLKISNLQLTPTNGKRLADSLRSGKQPLQYLDLSCNRLGKQGIVDHIAEYVVNVPEQNRTLAILNLESNQLDTSGAVDLFNKLGRQAGEDNTLIHIWLEKNNQLNMIQVALQLASAKHQMEQTAIEMETKVHLAAKNTNTNNGKHINKSSSSSSVAGTGDTPKSKQSHSHSLAVKARMVSHIHSLQKENRQLKEKLKMASSSPSSQQIIETPSENNPGVFSFDNITPRSEGGYYSPYSSPKNSYSPYSSPMNNSKSNFAQRMPGSSFSPYSSPRNAYEQRVYESSFSAYHCSSPKNSNHQRNLLHEPPLLQNTSSAGHPSCPHEDDSEFFAYEQDNQPIPPPPPLMKAPPSPRGLLSSSSSPCGSPSPSSQGRAYQLQNRMPAVHEDSNNSRGRSMTRKEDKGCEVPSSPSISGSQTLFSSSPSRKNSRSRSTSRARSPSSRGMRFMAILGSSKGDRFSQTHSIAAPKASKINDDSTLDSQETAYTKEMPNLNALLWSPPKKGRKKAAPIKSKSISSPPMTKDEIRSKVLGCVATTHEKKFNNEGNTSGATNDDISTHSRSSYVIEDVKRLRQGRALRQHRLRRNEEKQEEEQSQSKQAMVKDSSPLSGAKQEKKNVVVTEQTQPSIVGATEKTLARQFMSDHTSTTKATRNNSLDREKNPVQKQGNPLTTKAMKGKPLSARPRVYRASSEKIEKNSSDKQNQHPRRPSIGSDKLTGAEISQPERSNGLAGTLRSWRKNKSLPISENTAPTSNVPTPSSSKKNAVPFRPTADNTQVYNRPRLKRASSEKFRGLLHDQLHREDSARMLPAVERYREELEKSESTRSMGRTANRVMSCLESVDDGKGSTTTRPTPPPHRIHFNQKRGTLATK